eukprot:gb/GFBE01029237.1/.p1 GENE.gb/GFBE01029237.1/~~gb/GFBE01029237.1/.p1  ORF type:complete len:169 (+),score=58.01 gb/GFBE01029237.1/:1-507(+)
MCMSLLQGTVRVLALVWYSALILQFHAVSAGQLNMKVLQKDVQGQQQLQASHMLAKDAASTAESKAPLAKRVLSKARATAEQASSGGSSLLQRVLGTTSKGSASTSGQSGSSVLQRVLGGSKGSVLAKDSKPEEAVMAGALAKDAPAEDLSLMQKSKKLKLKARKEEL